MVQVIGIWKLQIFRRVTALLSSHHGSLLHNLWNIFTFTNERMKSLNILIQEFSRYRIGSCTNNTLLHGFTSSPLFMNLKQCGVEWPWTSSMDAAIHDLTSWTSLNEVACGWGVVLSLVSDSRSAIIIFTITIIFIHLSSLEPFTTFKIGTIIMMIMCTWHVLL